MVDLNRSLPVLQENRAWSAAGIDTVNADGCMRGIGGKGQIGPPVPQPRDKKQKVYEEKEDDPVERREVDAWAYAQDGLQLDGCFPGVGMSLLPFVFRHAKIIGRAPLLVNVSRCVLSCCRSCYDGKHDRFVV